MNKSGPVLRTEKSGSRPAAPVFEYASSPLQPYQDFMQAVTYAGVDEDNPALTKLVGQLNEKQQVAVASVLWNTIRTGETRGNVPIFVQSYQGFGATAYVSRSSNQQEASVALSCSRFSDLSAFPVVYYGNVTGYVPIDDAFTVLANGALRFENGAYNFSGLVNPKDGTIIGWSDTVFNQSSIVVSEVGWLVFNCQAWTLFSLPWYGELFHDIPRLFNTSNLFQYPESSQFTEYFASIFVLSLPFILLGTLFLLCGPVFILCSSCFSRCESCTFRSRKNKRANQETLWRSCLRCRTCCYFWSCFKRRSTVESERYQERTMHSRMENHSHELEIPQGGGRNVEVELTALNPVAEETEETSEVESNLSPQQLESSEKSDSFHRKVNIAHVLSSGGQGLKDLIDKVPNSQVLKLLGGLKTSRAPNLRNKILRQKELFEDVLKPSKLKVRIALGIVVLAEISMAPVGVFLNNLFSEAIADVLDSGDYVVTAFKYASGNASIRLSTVDLILDQCEDSLNGTQLYDALVSERQILVSYLNIVQPSNVVIANLEFLSSFTTYRVIAWVLVVVFMAIVSLAAIASLWLTCCTCKWNTKVIFTRISFHLGRGLRHILVVGCFLACLALGALTSLITAMSDLCSLPSFIQVNSTYANFTSSPGLQRAFQIYQYQLEYDFRNSNNTQIMRTTFNVGAFLGSCSYSENIFNPYSQLLLSANENHLSALKYASVIVNCTTPQILQEYISPIYYSNALNSTSCSNIGSSLGYATRSLCMDDGIFSMFMFFVTLILFNCFALVLIRSYRDILPNIYRISMAKDLAQTIQVSQKELRGLVSEMDSELAIMQDESHQALLL